MKSDGVPKWAERTMPRKVAMDTPTLVLIAVPGSGDYVVASLEEVDAIANPDSYLGRMLRPYTALLSLPYLFAN